MIQLAKSLKELYKRFIWLNINPESGTGVTQSYGYLGRVIDDRLVCFYPINEEGKVCAKIIVSISHVEGVCWSGLPLSRWRILANIVNFTAKKPDIWPDIQEDIVNVYEIG
jgi:hypothetical protein